MEIAESSQRNRASGEQDRAHLSPEARLKILLIERGLRPAELARRLGMSLAYVYQIISGKVISAKGRKRVESLLGVAIWSEPAAEPAMPEASESISRQAGD